MNDSEIIDFFRPYLGADETVLWTGRPQKGGFFTLQDGLVLLFGAVWLSFSVFWMASAFQSGAPVLFCLFGLPFVAVGLYLVFGRFLSAAYLRPRTFYALTDQRVLVRRGRHMQICRGCDLPDTQIMLHRNGSATVFFQNQVYTSKGLRTRTFLSLERIDDLPAVQSALERMRAPR